MTATRTAWHGRSARRRGTVLIATIFIITMLAGLVIVLCRSMRVEAIASANEAASVQASAIARGAEQYVLGMLFQESDAVRDLPDSYFSAVQLGDGYFWIVRPDYGDPDLPVFGLGDEGAKLNLNTASYDSILRLPQMTEPLAAAIVDWRDTDSTPRANGAENEYYSVQSVPYSVKNAPFETIEELLLVRDVTPMFLYGDGNAPPLGTPSSSFRSMGAGGGSSAAAAFNDPWLSKGLLDLITVHSAEPAPPAPAADDAGGQGGQGTDTTQPQVIDINNRGQRQQLRDLLAERLSSTQRADEIVGSMGNNTVYANIFDFYFRARLKPEEFDLIADSITANPPQQQGQPQQPQQPRNKVNVNTAPREVLLCLSNDLTEADVDKMLDARRTRSATTPTGIAWVAEALEQEKAVAVGNFVTGKSWQWTADIVAVSGNGRAYKRVRIIVDTTATTPQIVYRRDLSDRGWPMDPMILAALRAGEGPALLGGGFGSGGAGGGSVLRGGGSSQGGYSR